MKLLNTITWAVGSTAAVASISTSINGTNSIVIKANPLPAPVSMEWGSNGHIAISKRLKLNGRTNSVIKKAFSRTKDAMFKLQWVPEAVETSFEPILRPQDGNDASASASKQSLLSKWFSHGDKSISSIQLKVDDLDADLQLGVDESYVLNVTNSDILIYAPTTWGALHAFNTLQQLALGDGEGNLIVESDVNVSDKPLYAHRGIMMDSARHFLTVDSLLRQIDALSLAKMNVFHWHITDSQSWPVKLDSYPEMAKDAYSAREVYSKEDIKRVVEYAKERGVRVIPEIDMPGHSFNGWRQIDPDLLACATSKYSNNINHYQLDIMNPDVYPALEKVYNEVSGLFDDNIFHVGMDELEHNCFNFSQKIQDWFAEDASRTNDNLLEHWVEKTLPIFKNTESRRLMMWEDSVLSDLVRADNIPKDVIMQSWNAGDGEGNVRKLVDLGYDVVVSTSDFLYLDCGFSSYLANDSRYNVQTNPYTNGTVSFNYGGVSGSWCGPYKTHQRIYDFDFAAGLDEEQQKHIIGAEAALWSEQVDSTTLDQKLWPRAAALGELTWSGNRDASGNKRTYELTQRINNFREYLVANGINAVPLMPKWCATKRPHDCDILIYNSHV
ncbi:hypothetical protein TRVA0_001S03004 [Trichomonascus vanleenenianus]|uniref:beta-N-acetylhexosaminidase n=1 Tax=Trichomonascus vanleenenianus TaxID=2268995 RepID=UPI003ECA5011